jgi:PEP-CTERM motif
VPDTRPTQNLIGGPGIPDPGPPPPILPGTSISPVGATLTINGITLRIGDINRFIGLVQKRDNIFSGADSFQAQVHERPTVGFGNSRYLQIAVFSTINNIFTTSAFGEPIDRTLAAGDQSNSSFSFVNTDANGFSQGSVSGTFAVSTVKVSTVNAAAVPEPTSWILMLAGFGFIGGSLRQEARKPRAA